MADGRCRKTPRTRGEPRSEGPSFRWRDSIYLGSTPRLHAARPTSLSLAVTVPAQVLPNSSKLRSRPATPRSIRRRRTTDRLPSAGVLANSVASEIDRFFQTRRQHSPSRTRRQSRTFPEARQTRPTGRPRSPSQARVACPTSGHAHRRRRRVPSLSPRTRRSDRRRRRRRRSTTRRSRRIKEEGLQRSQAMDHVSWLADVYGPRLTGGPGIRQAAEWTKKKFGEWGLTNIHEESWAFGKGWQLVRFHAHMIEPQVMPIIGMPKSWTSSTNGTVQADVVLAAIATAADFDKYKGKLQGKIVLTQPSRAVRMLDGRVVLRMTDDDIAEANTTPVPPQRAGGGGGGRWSDSRSAIQPTHRAVLSERRRHCAHRPRLGQRPERRRQRSLVADAARRWRDDLRRQPAVARRKRREGTAEHRHCRRALQSDGADARARRSGEDGAARRDEVPRRAAGAGRIQHHRRDSRAPIRSSRTKS